MTAERTKTRSRNRRLDKKSDIEKLSTNTGKWLMFEVGLEQRSCQIRGLCNSLCQLFGLADFLPFLVVDLTKWNDEGP